MREAIARVIGLSFFASEHSTVTMIATAAGHVVMDGIMCASLDASEPPRMEAALTGVLKTGAGRRASLAGWGTASALSDGPQL